MRPVALVAVLVLAGCFDTSPDDDGREPIPDAAVNPGVCPAAPYEPCGVYDGGFDLVCTDGVVTMADLTETLYCLPGSTEIDCRGGRDTSPKPYHACEKMACNPDETQRHRYFETTSELSSFDPEDLCAP